MRSKPIRKKKKKGHKCKTLAEIWVESQANGDHKALDFLEV